MSWIEQGVKEKLEDPTNKKFLIGFALFMFGAITWGVVSVFKRDRQERDFIRREIHGVLTKMHFDQHGQYTITIRQYGTNEILEYYLFMSKFVTDNNIQETDSISKPANGHTINFFKKKQGKFYKCCDLYYY